MSAENYDVLLIVIFEIGAVIVFSLLTANILGKRGIPQVLGLIIGGLALQFIAVTGFPSPPTPEIHFIITTFALGLIGYQIGANLDLYKLREASWGLPLILLGEAIGSLIAVTVVMVIIFQDFILAILLGTISMATAPASTSEVIREYKAHGSLSQTVLFVVAFDNIIAIIFFSFAFVSAEAFYSSSDLSIFDALLPVAWEIGGAVILGILIALMMRPIHIEGVEVYRSAEYVFPAILICIALAGLLDFSVMLSCIVLGLTLSNMAHCEDMDCVRSVERLSQPLIALFFILVGFEMDLALLVTPTFVGILLYFLSRAGGKSLGAYASARISNQPEKVTTNLPLTLYTQAGVALGLVAFAYSRLSDIGTIEATSAAHLLLDIIIVSVLLAELVGPLFIKKALFRSGEAKDSINSV
ncbi:MAG: cation:proton antiporter [Candidatus Thorarchaeota archaeon]